MNRLSRTTAAWYALILYRQWANFSVTNSLQVVDWLVCFMLNVVKMIDRWNEARRYRFAFYPNFHLGFVGGSVLNVVLFLNHTIGFLA